MKFAPTLLSGLAALLLLASASPVSAQAQPKIGTIDLSKVFSGYFKTKQADVQLKDRAADSEKVMKGMVDDYQKSNEEYRKLIEGSNDQAVSTEERDKRKKTAESKLMEIQDLEKNVTQYRRQFAETMEEQKRRLRDNILREIRDVVNTKAKAGAYTMIIDTSANSVAVTPIVVYTNGQNDITDDVLTEMNAKAPPGVLDAKDKDTKK